MDYKYAEISSLKQKKENFDSEFPMGWFPLCYKDPQYLFEKILTSLTNIVSIKRTSRILIKVMLCQSDLIYIGLML